MFRTTAEAWFPNRGGSGQVGTPQLRLRALTSLTRGRLYENLSARVYIGGNAQVANDSSAAAFYGEVRVNN